MELREDDITAERHRLERDIVAAAALGSTSARASDKPVATLVNEPCTLGSRSTVDAHGVSGRRARVIEPCTELCQMGRADREAAPVLGRGPRVTEPCTERSALAAGRSKRVPGGDPLAVGPPSPLTLVLAGLQGSHPWLYKPRLAEMRSQSVHSRLLVSSNGGYRLSWTGSRYVGRFPNLHDHWVPSATWASV